jgi:hypothetical protein
MEQNKDNNPIQPNEKQGRDINNRSDIAKAHTGNPKKSGMEGDQSRSMGSKGQFSSRDADEKYGKETGNLDSKSNLKNQQSNTSDQREGTIGNPPDGKTSSGPTSGKPREQKTPAGTTQTGIPTSGLSSKKSGSGPSNT